MFTSIVGIGIANILMAFAGHVSALSTISGRQLGAAWLLILLLTFLGMFWNSTLLIQRDEWQYGLFLFVISGPVLLLFGSSLMTRLLNSEDAEPGDALRVQVLPRFFLIYAAVHAWFIGMDFVIGNGWGAATTVSAVLLLTATALALTTRQAVIWAFTVVMLVLSVVDVFLN
jgi:hypothetical protein